MTKVELESQLTNAKNNYVFGLAAISLFGSAEAYPILDRNSAKFGTYSVSFDQVANLFRNPKDRDIAVKEFYTSQLRALIKESFELLKYYCNESSQDVALKAEPWFQFARMIRNCLSHNFRFEFKRYDKSLLPITWNSRTIGLNMGVGTNLISPKMTNGTAQAFDCCFIPSSRKIFYSSQESSRAFSYPGNLTPFLSL